jgi:predicted metal-binding membrane protein
MMAVAVRRDRGASPTPALPVVLAIVAIAWAILLGGDVTGVGRQLHHHALISPGGPPLWLGALLFLGGWLVMVAGMMLPASTPAIMRIRAGQLRSFLLAYASIWLAFGLVAFIGDAGIHAFVHATPMLLQQPWLIGAATLTIAGAYQLTSAKHRALDACRDPLGAGHVDNGTDAGWRHALDCLKSSWALMLVMFGAGFAGLGWMLVLTALMSYEAIGPHGHKVASAFGILLLIAAAISAGVALTSGGVAAGIL